MPNTELAPKPQPERKPGTQRLATGLAGAALSVSSLAIPGIASADQGQNPPQGIVSPAPENPPQINVGDKTMVMNPDGTFTVVEGAGAMAEGQPANETTSDPTKAVLLETDNGSIMQEYRSTNGVVKLINFSDPTDKFLLFPRENSLDKLETIAQRKDIPDQQGKFWPVDGISIILDPNLQSPRVTGIDVPGIHGLVRRIPGVPYDPRAPYENITLTQHIYTYTPEGNRFIEIRLNKGQWTSPLTEDEVQTLLEMLRGDLTDAIFLIKSGSPEYNSGFPGINDLPIRTLGRELYDMQPFQATLYPQATLAMSQ